MWELVIGWKPSRLGRNPLSSGFDQNFVFVPLSHLAQTNCRSQKDQSHKSHEKSEIPASNRKCFTTGHGRINHQKNQIITKLTTSISLLSSLDQFLSGQNAFVVTKQRLVLIFKGSLETHNDQWNQKENMPWYRAWTLIAHTATKYMYMSTLVISNHDLESVPS